MMWQEQAQPLCEVANTYTREKHSDKEKKEELKLKEVPRKAAILSEKHHEEYKPWSSFIRKPLSLSSCERSSSSLSASSLSWSNCFSESFLNWCINISVDDVKWNSLLFNQWTTNPPLISSILNAVPTRTFGISVKTKKIKFSIWCSNFFKNMTSVQSWFVIFLHREDAKKSKSAWFYQVCDNFNWI